MRTLRTIAATVALGAFAWWVGAPLVKAESTRLVPPPARDAVPTPAPTETAILAGGCFWGVQDLLRRYSGVISTRVGYSGGRRIRASQERSNSDYVYSFEILTAHDQLLIGPSPSALVSPSHCGSDIVFAWFQVRVKRPPASGTRFFCWFIWRRSSPTSIVSASL